MKAYVVYHVASTMMMGPTPNGHPHSDYAKVYKTAAGAKKAAAKFGSEYSWAEMSVYEKSVVHMVEKTNLMSGKKYMEASNTPGYMSVSSEAYWSM